MKGAKIQGYGSYAIEALKLYNDPSNKTTLLQAWVQVGGNKGDKWCPRNAFLTLYYEGKVKGFNKRIIKGINDNVREATLMAMKKIDFVSANFSNYSALWRSLNISQQDNGILSVIHALYEYVLLNID